MQVRQNKELSRGQFLKQMGMSSKALMAFYCMGAISACTKEDGAVPIIGAPGVDPVDTTGISGSTSGTDIKFTVDLTNGDFSKLKTDGEFAYAGDIIIANIGNGAFLALAKSCTHQGTTVIFRKESNDFMCPNHGSEFASDGSVTQAPASSGLKSYTVTLSADKNTLDVS
ncbi:MAG: cytochrome b6-f complex iron-sulfur subunit [Arcticibacterium sp.]|jgi:cytochrome b6-f complex iron-sulfur subunit